MKAIDIQGQLKDYKIREGYLLKRSRVLREWRRRWMVLTLNYLFSFENDTCNKLTEAIDLREVLSLKSNLKSTEEPDGSSFSVQTRSTDFALSGCETEEKWSWIVTLERLFDFKEKGASQYNNIDMVKSQGFESQNEFIYKQKVKVKTRSGRTISLHQEKRRKEEDELLHALRIKQEEVKRKEELLRREEISLHKEKKSNSDFSIQIDQMNSQLRRLHDENELLREEVRQLRKQKIGCLLGESSCQTDEWEAKKKSIEYLLREFQSGSNAEQQAIITDFLLRLSEKEEFVYHQVISQVVHHHKDLSYFIKSFLGAIGQIIARGNTQAYRVLALMEILFKDQHLLELNYFVEAQRVTLEWAETFSNETPVSILGKTVRTLMLLCLKSNELRQRTMQAIRGLSRLSDSQELVEGCRQALRRLIGEG